MLENPRLSVATRMASHLHSVNQICIVCRFDLFFYFCFYSSSCNGVGVIKCVDTDDF